MSFEVSSRADHTGEIQHVSRHHFSPDSSKLAKTHANTNTHTHAHKHKQTNTHTHTYTHTHIQRHTDTQTHRHTHTHTHTQTDKHKHLHTLLDSFSPHAYTTTPQTQIALGFGVQGLSCCSFVAVVLLQEPRLQHRPTKRRLRTRRSSSSSNSSSRRHGSGCLVKWYNRVQDVVPSV